MNRRDALKSMLTDMTKKPITKRNPQDATLRNARAAKKRADDIRLALNALDARITALEAVQVFQPRKPWFSR